MPKPTVSYLFILLVVTVKSFSQQNYGDEVKQTAISFINSLDPLQKRSALLSFGDTARVKWNNLPVGLRARAGISIGNLDDTQRILLHRILSASLSSQGYLKATSIMHMDNLILAYYDSLFHQNKIDSSELRQLEQLQWSHRNYFLAFFGLPTDSNWAYKIEGHHLSVNFTFSGNRLSVTPLFLGSDPAEYRVSEYAGWRILGQEEDLGIKLINMLSPSQQKKATMSQDVPMDIITSAESGKRLIDYWGIRGADMNKEQVAVLKYIVREFVFDMEYDKAVTEYDKILDAGIDKVYFGWIGPYKENEPHYYILNGPTFLIEFDNRGFGNGNHIHCIWREKGNEFGEDILKKHYLMEKH